MSSKARIIWIDDNPSRKKQATDLQDDSGMRVEFISVKDKDLEEAKISIRDNYKPELVIIDHVLDKAISISNVRYGSTLTGYFREKWVGCPFIGITAAGNIPDINIEKNTYDELIEGDKFSEYIKFIPNIIKGFKKCSKSESIEKWIKQINPPKEEIDRIRNCLPHEIKINISKPGFSNRIYRWFRSKFYRMPGLLYDKNWVSAFTGIKKEAIDGYLKYFKDAKYDGLFNDPHNPRWWKAKLYQLIYSKCKEDNIASLSPQEVSNKIYKVNKYDRSVCYVCKEIWPETIAYVDDANHSSIAQMHLKCTLAHPQYPYEPMFEEIRMMRT